MKDGGAIQPDGGNWRLRHCSAPATCKDSRLAFGRWEVLDGGVYSEPVVCFGAPRYLCLVVAPVPEVPSRLYLLEKSLALAVSLPCLSFFF